MASEASSWYCDSNVNRLKESPLSALSSSSSGKSAGASVPVPPSSETVTTVEDPQSLAHLVAAKLEQDKAEDILEIDLTGKSPMADMMIVASGRSQRHVSALADHVSQELKKHGVKKVRVEGLTNADWVLIDGGDVIVHIFRPEVRDFYNLERIWGESPSGHTSAQAGDQTSDGGSDA